VQTEEKSKELIELIEVRSVDYLLSLPHWSPGGGMLVGRANSCIVLSVLAKDPLLFKSH
jgi:hypothetical protein